MVPAAKREYIFPNSSLISLSALRQQDKVDTVHAVSPRTYLRSTYCEALLTSPPWLNKTTLFVSFLQAKQRITFRFSSYIRHNVSKGYGSAITASLTVLQR